MTQASFNGAGPSNPGGFRIVRWREGYRIDEVDVLVDRIATGAVTSDEVHQARLTPVRLRPGYDMSDVDKYLDRTEADLRASGG